MELKEFISETLKQINDGIVEGSEYSRTKGGKGLNSKNIKISFDVAVTTSNEGLKEGGAKITVASVFSVGGGASNKDTSTFHNRIQFEILFRPSTKFNADAYEMP